MIAVTRVRRKGTEERRQTEYHITIIQKYKFYSSISFVVVEIVYTGGIKLKKKKVVVRGCQRSGIEMSR